MASLIFNESKGRGVQFYKNVKENSPANSALVVVALKLAVADATMKDFANLSLLLADAGNTECDFTNYARKILTDTDIPADPGADNANDWYEVDLNDLVYAAAGGALNNTLVKIVICYDGDTAAGNDTDLIPISAADFSVNPTTDGTTLTIQSSGFFRAT